MFTKTLAVAALAAIPALAGPNVNVYFGQQGTERLKTYCDTPGFEYVTIGFVNQSPEQDTKSGLNLPGTNFANHCTGGYYKGSNGVNSPLLSQCGVLSADVRYCQKKGKKVLLSIGGVYDKEKANYKISSPPEGEKFAEFIWGAFGPYKSTWKWPAGKGKGPRPFDDSYAAEAGDEHFVFDGFDFDIEEKFSELSFFMTEPGGI